MTWFGKNIPSQAGRSALVTGANSGLGYETTKVLAAAGASVVMACRNDEKAQAARAKLLAELPTADLTIELLDLSSLRSVAAFVERLVESNDHLDLLINNAGVMATPPQMSEDGIEYQFACNHTGHFALTAGLMPLLMAADSSRVVALSSLAARSGSLVDYDPTSLASYDPMSVYQATKLANQVFAVELDRRLRAAGAQTISVAAHPGLAETNLFANFGDNPLMQTAARLATKVVTQSAAAGALPTLMAATAPNVAGGSYFGPGLPGEMWGPPKKIDVLKRAADEGTGQRLWDLSVDLTGVEFAV